MNDTVKKQAQPIVANEVTPMSMLQMAVEKGADADQLEKLLNLQERVMKNQAESDFNLAMQNFQSNCPPISKNETGVHGSTYASLDHIALKIAPILSQFGLSYSFNANMGEGVVNVTCTVKHVSGHRETSQFSAPIDAQAKMSDTHKTASALSYARRYALMMALGITTGDIDDDGFDAGTKYIDGDQAILLENLIVEVGADKVNFLKYLKVDSLGVLPADKFTGAMTALEAKKVQK